MPQSTEDSILKIKCHQCPRSIEHVEDMVIHQYRKKIAYTQGKVLYQMPQYIEEVAYVD